MASLKRISKTGVETGQTIEALQVSQSFDAFNPNRCNLGKNLFDNHTRQQTKDVKLK